jgi:hypothetical protein
MDLKMDPTLVPLAMFLFVNFGLFAILVHAIERA